MITSIGWCLQNKITKELLRYGNVLVVYTTRQQARMVRNADEQVVRVEFQLTRIGK